MKALKRINDALPGLVGGIVLYGLLLWGIGIWFVSDRLAFSVGLWIGVACAVGMSIHIARVLDDSVRMGESSVKRLAAMSVARYLVVAVIFFLTAYFRIGDILAAFIGILGLKISAYAQPGLKKLYSRMRGHRA